MRTLHQKIDNGCQEIDDKTEFTPDKRILRLLDSSSVWRDDALGYIGGCIVKNVAEDQTTIPNYLSYTEICPNNSNKLIALKSYHNGALTIPSPPVLKVAHVTDKYFGESFTSGIY